MFSLWHRSYYFVFLIRCVGSGHAHRYHLAGYHQEQGVRVRHVPNLPRWPPLHSRPPPGIRARCHWPSRAAAKVWVQEQSIGSRGNEASLLRVVGGRDTAAAQQWVLCVNLSGLQFKHSLLIIIIWLYLVVTPPPIVVSIFTLPECALTVNPGQKTPNSSDPRYHSRG